MTTNPDKEKLNPFDQLRYRPMVRPPVYIPSERAGQRIFEQIYGPFKEHQVAFGLSDTQMATLMKFASAAAAKEKQKVQRLSESTAAHQVDEVLADIQGEAAVAPILIGERRIRISSLAKVRRDLRSEINNARVNGLRDAAQFKEFGDAGEEAVLREWFSYGMRLRGNIEVPAEVSKLVFTKMEIDGCGTFEEFDKKRDRYWNTPDGYSWLSNLESNVPGVVFTVTKWSGKGIHPAGVTLEIKYKHDAYKENYRWFDTTKPVTTPPF